jgi:hypothetical protein
VARFSGRGFTQRREAAKAQREEEKATARLHTSGTLIYTNLRSQFPRESSEISEDQRKSVFPVLSFATDFRKTNDNDIMSFLCAFAQEPQIATDLPATSEAFRQAGYSMRPLPGESDEF